MALIKVCGGVGLQILLFGPQTEEELADAFAVDFLEHKVGLLGDGQVDFSQAKHAPDLFIG